MSSHPQVAAKYCVFVFVYLSLFVYLCCRSLLRRLLETDFKISDLLRFRSLQRPLDREKHLDLNEIKVGNQSGEIETLEWTHF